MTFEEWVTKYQRKHNVTFGDQSLKVLKAAWEAAKGEMRGEE